MAQRPLHECEPANPVVEAMACLGGTIISDTANESPVQVRAAVCGPIARMKDGTVLSVGIGKSGRMLYCGWPETAIRIDHGARHVRQDAAAPV
jgi:hypothetical protein